MSNTNNQALMKTLIRYFPEKEFRTFFPSSIQPVSHDDALSRLDKLGRLRLSFEPAITETARLKKIAEGPVRLFPCPKNLSSAWPEAEYGLYLMIHRNGRMRFIVWGKGDQTTHGNETVLDFLGEEMAAPKERQNHPLNLSQIYVRWAPHSRRKLCAIVVYADYGEEVVPMWNDYPSSRTSIPPIKEDQPPFATEDDSTYVCLGQGWWCAIPSVLEREKWNNASTKGIHVWCLDSNSKVVDSHSLALPTPMSQWPANWSLAADNPSCQLSELTLWSYSYPSGLFQWRGEDRPKTIPIHSAHPPTSLCIVNETHPGNSYPPNRRLLIATRGSQLLLSPPLPFGQNPTFQTIHIPETIMQILPAQEDPAQFLFREKGGKLRALKLYSPTHVDESIASLLIGAQITRFDPEKSTLHMDAKGIRSLVHRVKIQDNRLSPRMWFPLRWMMLKAMGRDTTEQDREAWNDFLEFFQTQDNPSLTPDKRSRLSRLMADLLVNVGEDLFSDTTTPTEDQLKLFKNTFKVLWANSGEAAWMTLWQRQHQLATYFPVAETDVFAKSLNDQWDLSRELSLYYRGVQTKIVHTQKDPIKKLVPDRNGQHLVAVTTRSLILLKKNPKDTFDRWTAPKTFSIPDIFGADTQLSVLIQLDTREWLAISQSGHVCLFGWTTELAQPKKSMACKGLPDGFVCLDGWMDTPHHNNRNLWLCGLNNQGLGQLLLLKLPSNPENRQHHRQTMVDKGEDIHPWEVNDTLSFVKERGPMTTMVATKTHIYVASPRAQIIYRSPRYPNYAGTTLEVWLRFPSEPRSLFAIEDSQDTWTLLVGDDRGILWSIRENSRDAVDERPILNSFYAFPSSINTLWVGHYQQDTGTNQKRKVEVICAGTSWDGVLLMNRSDGVLQASLRHICPPLSMIAMDHCTFAAAVGRGSIWIGQIGDFPWPTERPERSLSYQKGKHFPCLSQYALGYPFLSHIRQFRWSTFEETLQWLQRAHDCTNHGLSGGGPNQGELHRLSPLRFFLAEAIARLLCITPDTTETPEEQVVNKMKEALFGLIEDWLVHSKEQIQAHAANTILEEMIRDSAHPPANIPPSHAHLDFLDEGLTLWFQKLGKCMIASIVSNSKDTVERCEPGSYRCQIMRPLIRAIIFCAEKRPGSQCGKVLNKFLKTDLNTMGISRSPGFIIAQELISLGSSFQDPVSTMTKCLDRLALFTDFRIDRSLFQRVFKEIQPKLTPPDLNGMVHAPQIEAFGPIPFFWPQPIWDFTHILFSDDLDGKAMVTAMGDWWKKEKRFFENREELIHWVIPIEWLLYILEAPLNDFILDRPVPSVKPCMLHDKKLNIFSHNYRKWFMQLLRTFKNHQKHNVTSQRTSDRVSTLKTLAREVTVNFPELNVLEYHIKDLIQRTWSDQCAKLEENLRNLVPQQIQNEPEKLLQIEVVEISQAGSQDTVTLQITNFLPWPLEISFSGEYSSEKRIDIPSSDQKKSHLKIDRDKLEQDHLQLQLLLYHRMGHQEQCIPFFYRLELTETLDGWIRSAKLDHWINETLRHAILEKEFLILQTSDPLQWRWRLERLIHILTNRHNYPRTRIHLLAAGALLTDAWPEDALGNVAWLPLDFRWPNAANIRKPEGDKIIQDQLLLYFHKPPAPRFSPLAATLVAPSPASTPFDREFLSLLPDDFLELKNTWLAGMPLEIQNWLKEHQSQLCRSFSWMFGTESDLPRGYLFNLDVWRKYLAWTKAPEIFQLSDEEFRAIQQRIQSVWPVQQQGNFYDILELFKENNGLGFRPLQPEKLWGDVLDPIGFCQGQLSMSRSVWRPVSLLFFNKDTKLNRKDLEEITHAIGPQTENSLIIVIGDHHQQLSNSGITERPDLVHLGSNDFLRLLVWERPKRALALELAQRLPPSRWNPFNSRHGLHDRPQMFHGRTDILNRILNSMNTGDCFLIVGARRLGKTSLLEKVEYELKLRQQKVIRLDFQAAMVRDSEGGIHKSAFEIFSRAAYRKLETISVDPPPGTIPTLEQWTAWFRLQRRQRTMPMILVDEAQELFKKDRTDVPDPVSIRYSKTAPRTYHPLFSWFRQLSNDPEIRLPMVFTSYPYGPTQHNQLDRWSSIIPESGHNFLHRIDLPTWSNSEAESFLRDVSEDLGIYLPGEYLAFLQIYSRHLPWMLQEMGHRLLIQMGRLENIRPIRLADVKRVVRETLLAEELQANESCISALNSLLDELEQESGDKQTWAITYQEKQALQNQLWKRLQKFSQEEDVYSNQIDDTKDFTQSRIRDYLIECPMGKRLGSVNMDRFVTNLDTTTLLNGWGAHRYQFNAGLFPCLVRWLKEKELQHV